MPTMNSRDQHYEIIEMSVNIKQTRSITELSNIDDDDTRTCTNNKYTVYKSIRSVSGQIVTLNIECQSCRQLDPIARIKNFIYFNK